MDLEDLGKRITEVREDSGLHFAVCPDTLEHRTLFFEQGIVPTDVPDEFIDLDESFEQNPKGFIDGLELPENVTALYVVTADAPITLDATGKVPALKVVGCIDVGALTFEQNIQCDIELDTPTR